MELKRIENSLSNYLAISILGLKMLSLILYPISLYNYVSVQNLIFVFIGRVYYYNNDSFFFFGSIAVHVFNSLDGRINLGFNIFR